MTVGLFSPIRLPYREAKAGPVASTLATRRGAVHLPNLSAHLLRDIGLFDTSETRQVRAEPPRSARDLVDRYR
jgi:hypothetical protein